MKEKDKTLVSVFVSSLKDSVSMFSEYYDMVEYENDESRNNVIKAVKILESKIKLLDEAQDIDDIKEVIKIKKIIKEKNI